MPGFSGTLKISDDNAVEGIYADNAKVYSNGGNCIIENTETGDFIGVYGVDGTTFYEGKSEREALVVPVLRKCIVIVRIVSADKENTYKLTIK